MKLKQSRRRRSFALICAILILSLLVGCAKSGSAGPSAASGAGTELPTSAATATPTAGSKTEEGTSGTDDLTNSDSDGDPITAGEPELPAGTAIEFSRDSAGRGGLAYDAPSAGSGPLSGTGDASGSPSAGEGDEPGDTGSPFPPVSTGTVPDDPWAEPDPAALILTAAEWNDNANWAFFTNLITADKIHFPAFGVDPRNRIAVTLTDAAGSGLANEDVSLCAGDGTVLWRAKTDSAGIAYLFFTDGQTPDYVLAAGTQASVNVEVPDQTGQGNATRTRADEITVVGEQTALPLSAMQIMFIVDTTGSMADELCYLQMDFSKIAEDVGNSGVTYSACFYRDEGDDYVTRVNPFTSDIGEVQSLINAEQAEGGGDTPEAVAEILTETLSPDAGWESGAVKLAFLIFDAPPHEGKEAELNAAIKTAAEQGIRLIPVVASNADRETELFGRAVAVCTNGTYVFLTDDSGVGGSHLEPIVGSYEVELLHDLIVRIIEGCKPALD